MFLQDTFIFHRSNKQVKVTPKQRYIETMIQGLNYLFIFKLIIIYNVL